MGTFLKFWGELRESWADVSVLIVALLGVILAIIPAKVAEREQHQKFGKIWKYGLSGFLLFVGITGFMQGRADKHDFLHQIAQLSATEFTGYDRGYER